MSIFSNITIFEYFYLVLFLLTFCVLGWYLRKLYKKMYFLYLKYKGNLGEKKAIKILKKNGYQILKQQFYLKGKLYENNQVQSFLIKPDFLVKKNNEIFIAEVKTGESANLSNISTRRQLLEYSVINNSKKIILVDINKKSLNIIEFLFYM